MANRFFSCPVEEDRVWQMLSYIELNPVRAGIRKHAWDWEWSSAKAHVTGLDPTGLLDMELWRRHFDGAGWRDYLQRMAEESTFATRIRKATTTGRFFGSEATARRLELEQGLTILPRKRGRKPKAHPGR